MTQEHQQSHDRDATSASRNRVPLRHRIPVRLRHYWKLAAVAVAGVVAVAVLFGTSTVRPYITSDLVAETHITNDIDGGTDLFDGGEHSIEISYNDTEYKDMLSTFEEDGEKDFIRADITIDGTVIRDVGLRLKGNSTLSSLSGDGGMPGGKDMPQMPQGDGQGKDQGKGKAKGDAQGKGQGQAKGGAKGQGKGAAEQGGDPGGMPMVQLSEDKPEEIPWLISFEEFKEGRAYQGHTEIALRPASGESDTALNEALSLALTKKSGQTTQDTSFTSVTVNGGDSAARLLIDIPDALWAESQGNGVLYKARAGGSFAYRGEDPTDYEESFKQINAEGSYDTQPIINLLKFVDESDDKEFAADLEDHLDVESFATYLATQELLSNWDGMDGAGNNYYLWYDTDDQKFTVLSWDLNLALSGMGGAPGGGEGMPEMPEGGAEGMPEGMPEGGPGGGGGGQSPGSGKLKERFLEDDSFYQLYEKAYADLHDELIDSGYASDTLTQLAGQATEAGDEDTSSAVSSIKQKLSEITEKAPEPSKGMGGAPGRKE